MSSILRRQKRASLDKHTLNRLLIWGKHLMGDPNFRWTTSDTKAMGSIADEIRRVEHDVYLIRKGLKQGYKR